MSVRAISNIYHTVTPFPLVKGTPRLINVLKAAFDATELMRFHESDGTVARAELKIGDSIMMIGEATEGVPAVPASLHLYVADVDETYQAALTAGGESLQEPMNRLWGDRIAAVQDPAGNKWWISAQL
jgi:PhnB protein